MGLDDMHGMQKSYSKAGDMSLMFPATQVGVKPAGRLLRCLAMSILPRAYRPMSVRH